MNNIIDVAIHGGRDVAAGIVDAMVGNAVLREIVGADFFAAVAGANEGFASFGSGFHFFFFFALQEARA